MIICVEGYMLKSWLFGLIAGSALIIGASLGYYLAIPRKVAASVMAFGSGVLIAALSFNLVDEAYNRGGLTATAVGFLVGAIVFTVANVFLSRKGAKHRKRSDEKQAKSGGSGIAIAVGSLLDDIPEAIVIGLSLIGGGAVGFVTMGAIFLSNIPEGLSSSTGMKKAGRTAGYVFGLWGSIALITSLSALAGFSLFQGSSPTVVAGITSFAAGGILAMIVDTMIPEAFDEERSEAGFVAVIGFLLAYAFTKFGQ
jgi:ZIP family zinc transporter